MNEAKRFLSGSLIVFVGSIVASVFSYLFNMLMGRLLGPVQYGQMATIMSLLTILSVCGGVVTTITMFYTGELYGLEKFGAIKKLFKILTRYIFFISLFFFLAGIAIAKPIANFFAIDSIVPVIIAFSGFLIGFVALINKGVLQGTQRFTAFSAINILEMLLKVSIAVLLVKIGLAVSGAMLAMVLASLIAYLVSFWPLSKIFIKEKKGNDDFHFDKKDMLAYTYPVILNTFVLTVLLNLDIMLVKHYFPADQAGLYAATSTVAKIILYITSPIISVMFPMIMEKKSKGEKHYKMLIASLALTTVAALMILGVYEVVPGFVMNLLYGTSYTALFYLLPQIGLFALFYTLINLFANYYLAIKDFMFLWFMSACLVVSLVWSVIYHPSISIVVRIFIICAALTFALMFAYYLLTKKEQILTYIGSISGKES